MISDDDGRVASTIAAEANAAIDEGKEVMIWLASGKTIEGVTRVGYSGFFLTISHPSLTWRFRIDHVVGFSAK